MKLMTPVVFLSFCVAVVLLRCACDSPAFRNLPGTQEAMQRAARWWLCTSRMDREGPIPTIDRDDREARGRLKFSRFTWCRFMAAASLMRIAELTGEQEPWQQLALTYLEHVDTKLRNETNVEKAPFKRATTDEMTLCSWIQAIEWAGVLQDWSLRRAFAGPRHVTETSNCGRGAASAAMSALFVR